MFKTPLELGQTVLRNRYRLIELLTPDDAASGLPALYRVSDSGSFAFAKIWRDDSAFPEFKSIWTHEVRSLLRLGGLPFAEEMFVKLRELGTDDVGFVVILDGDGREPLSKVLSERKNYDWLSDIRSPRLRRRLWQGLHRVARGLAMMHAEGTLHRMLRKDSVFTDVDGLCDFRLSGFEWSLRVGSAGRERTPAIEAPELSQPALQYSVASDWFSFGVLCADVLLAATPSPTIGGLDDLRRAIERAPITPAERVLLVNLIQPDPEKRIWHSADVTGTIEDIVEVLSAERDRARRPLYVGFDLNPSSKLSKLIARQSNGSIPSSDVDGQLSFISDDLGPEPQVSARLRPFPHYILHGARIDYQLRKWPAWKAWDAALCTQNDPFPSIEPNRSYRFPGRRFELRSSAWIAENPNGVRKGGDPWTDAFPIEDERNLLGNEQARTVDFFRVTNQLEALLIITQVWPVRVLATSSSGDDRFVDITPVQDDSRDDLAELLGVPTAPEQMRSLFQQDEVVGRRAAEQTFVFTDEGRLSRRDTSTVIPWRFVEYREDSKEPLYRFTSNGHSARLPSGTTYLKPFDLAGSNVLLHRRKKAIEDLCAHRLLLDAIEEPSSVKQRTVDEIKRSSAISELDPSKQLALTELWRSQPLYMLQGPPGTGKTTLIATMIDEQIRASSATQILVSAQSHSTVETVMREVMVFPHAKSAPLAVRLDADDAHPHSKKAIATRLSSKLRESDFAKQAPANIKNRLDGLDSDSGPIGAAERSGFERLIEEGAGVVFSTSNSGDLSRLLDNGRRYDWSIIEEAGRAHGFDLALSLQASHRILMIGDQQQLPAFNLETLDNLLREPAKVIKALKYGNRYAPTLIERYFVKDAASDPNRFASACEAWRVLLPFFDQLFRRCEHAGTLDGEPIARQLTQQHRMHPEIMRFVRECFYPDLEIAKRAKDHFDTEPDQFERTTRSWMPSERVVFIDVPWIQRGKNARGENTRPRYSSSTEAEIIVEALTQFRRKNLPLREGAIKPKRPTIQILSPYRAQVRRIERIAQRMQADELLPYLGEFDTAKSDGSISATVDEFQGNQADIVLVSLVRNNHSKRGKGLGFVADGRRWNVLLSRAKRKLILVGSWDFLRSRFPANKQLSPDDPMFDLAKVVRSLEAAFGDGGAARIKLHEIPRLKQQKSASSRARSRRHRP